MTHAPHANFPVSIPALYDRLMGPVDLHLFARDPA